MVCPNCGLNELRPPYDDMQEIEVCNWWTGCGYIFRQGQYDEPLYTPREQGAPPEPWPDHICLYRQTHKTLPS